MKKMIFAYVALAFAVTSAAAEKRDLRIYTAQEVRAAYQAALSAPASTNLSALTAALRACEFWSITWTKDAEVKAFRLTADNELAARGLGAMWEYTLAWPKVSAIARAANGASTNASVRLSLAARLGCDATFASLVQHGATVADVAACLAEEVTYAADNRVAGSQSIAYAKRALQSLAAKSIKKALRRQGKSFVSKDGVNPCAEALASLSAALNAPRFAGLGDWLREYGFAEGFEASFPSEAYISDLRAKVLDGDIDLTLGRKQLLSICLGVEGYNAFVKEYNGD